MEPNWILLVIFQILLLAPLSIITLYNYFFRTNINKTSVRQKNKVSVLIPARDEERNISQCLLSVLKSDLENLEIIVLNDGSTDHTVEIVNEIIKEHSASFDIQLINGKPLPHGWLGKNWACHQLSLHANGEYLIFIDADVRVDSWFISSTIEHMKKHKLGFLSVFPFQITKTWSEKLTVTYLTWLLVSLLPIKIANNSSFQSLAAANGQFMLFDKITYAQINGHESVAKEVLEDMAIARNVKKSVIPMQFLLQTEGIYCRMYSNFVEVRNGLSKNITKITPLPIFAYINLVNVISVIGSILGLFISPLFFLTIVIIFAQRLFAGSIYGFSWYNSLLSILPQTLLIMYIQLVAITNNFGQGLKWKKRLVTN